MKPIDSKNSHLLNVVMHVIPSEIQRRKLLMGKVCNKTRVYVNSWAGHRLILARVAWQGLE